MKKFLSTIENAKILKVELKESKNGNKYLAITIIDDFFNTFTFYDFHAEHQNMYTSNATGKLVIQYSEKFTNGTYSKNVDIQSFEPKA